MVIQVNTALTEQMVPQSTEIKEEAKAVSRQPNLQQRVSHNTLQSSPAPSSSACACKEVLIVDDDDFNRLTFQSVLQTLNLDS